MEELSDDDDNDDDIECVVYTANEIMKQGLLLVNYTRKRIRRAKMKRNIERFKGHFGSKPSVIAKIWEDLQTTQVAEARVLAEDLHMNLFLMAMHHLKRYPTELEREPIFDIDCTKGRDWAWFFVEKIQQLKKEKIVWPADNFGMALEKASVWFFGRGWQRCFFQLQNGWYTTTIASIPLMFVLHNDHGHRLFAFDGMDKIHG
jgi:hypothetical protein